MENNSYTKDKEWQEAIRKAQCGDGETRDQLVEKNIGLVHMVLKRFSGRGYEMDDLFQIGTIGLIKAIDRFDISFGYSFSTYAVPIIIGEIRRYLRDDGLLHVSRKIKEDLKNIMNYMDKARSILQREPTLQEIEEGTGIKKEEILLALESGYEVESLSKPIGREKENGEKMLLQDCISNLEYSENNYLDIMLLKQIMGRLSIEEQQLIRARYFWGKTQQETGKLMNMNQVAVSRKEKKVLQKLRLYLEER